jgi:hypothetical protein
MKIQCVNRGKFLDFVPAFPKNFTAVPKTNEDPNMPTLYFHT